ncbi:MAG: insulinase family protein [Armatimonadetes bacterium]|nr:insulinase family protein [Armatimonadota bacterium]
MISRLTRNNRKVFAFIIAWLLVTSSALAQATGVIETKLPNGLTVLMKESHAAPVFTAQVWFRVGSRNEHTGITGISHLLEHMLFNSSKNYKKGEITRIIREKGGIENAATWTDFTYYWQLMSSEHLELSLKTLAERVGNALLLDSEFQKERTVVLSERQGRENDPGWQLYQGLMSTAFQAHPYQWPVIGWQSDVENISRSQLTTYYHTYYHPNNATLVLVGDFDPKKALALVRKYFGKKPPAKMPKQVYTNEPRQRGKREINIRLRGNAERIQLGYHGPAIDDPDSYAMMILDQILSGGRSSRLYQALVEKQLATSAWSSADIRRDPGLFILGATARHGVNIATVESALLAEVEKIKSSPPSEEEIQAARNQLQAYVVFQNDSVSDQGEQLGYYNTVTSWRYLETLIPRINAVTARQVQEVARKYLVEDNLTIARFIPTDGEASGPEGEDYSGEVQYSKGCEFYRTPPLLSPRRRARGKSVSLPVSLTARMKSGESRQQAARPYRETLPNGLVVIVHENHSNPTIAVAGNIKAGSYFDPPGKSGVANLVAETITRGTKNRTALEIAKQIDFVGASIDTSSGVESAEFRARCLTKDLPMILDVLADELMNASFPEDQFERAKGEALSRLVQSEESPDAQAMRAFYHAVFPPGHPYHMLNFEDAKNNLKAIAREDLAVFYKTYYRPDTTIIVIAGDVGAKEAVELVKRAFGNWRAEGPPPNINIPTVQPQTQGAKIAIPMEDKSEVSLLFGHALGLKRSDPDFYAVRVMNQILGGAGALASILGNEIREKRGLAYDVYSTFEATLGAGPWYTALGTSPRDLDEALNTLKENIAKFKKDGPTKKQFEQAREFIVGVFPIALETNAGIARQLLNAEFYGLGVDYLSKYAEVYRSVTFDQVKAAAAKYLNPEAATLVVAGPGLK